MKTFEFKLPDDTKHKIKYDENSNKEEIVNDIINEWHSYINSNWVCFNKQKAFTISPEQKVKYMLESLVTFLAGRLDNKYPKDISLDYVKDNKKPLKTINDSNNVLLGLQTDQKTYNKNNKRKIKKYKQSKTYKIIRIFSKKDIKLQEIYKLTNKDVFGLNELLNMRKKLNLVTEQDYTAWLEKPAKNLFNQNIFTIKKKTYKGWQGIINTDIPYISKWCYVNSIGEFEFNSKKYLIDIEKIPQYQDIRKDKYLKNESGWSMDNIYCVEQEEKLYFWDMDIVQLCDKYISKTEEKD